MCNVSIRDVISSWLLWRITASARWKREGKEISSDPVYQSRQHVDPPKSLRIGAITSTISLAKRETKVVPAD
jgi:hypothetical protein